MHSRVKALIDNVGKKATYKVATSTYDPNTRSNTSVYVDYPVLCFFSGNRDSRLGSEIANNTKQVYISALSLPVTPSIAKDILLVGTDSYNIISSDVRHIKGSDAMIVLTVALNGK